MSSLSFPDVNVWLALLLEDHAHRPPAVAWWQQADSPETIAFCRITQISVLRLLTTPAAMNQRPLTMPEAWAAYDRLYEDDRVAYLHEPMGLEPHFRRAASSQAASPKVWADAYLLAYTDALEGSLVTFDRALAARTQRAILLGEAVIAANQI